MLIRTFSTAETPAISQPYLEPKPLFEPMMDYCQLDPWEQWNLNGNLHIFIRKDAFKNVRKLAAILSRPQCVNTSLEGLIIICSALEPPAARAVLHCDQTRHNCIDPVITWHCYLLMIGLSYSNKTIIY